MRTSFLIWFLTVIVFCGQSEARELHRSDTYFLADNKQQVTQPPLIIKVEPSPEEVQAVATREASTARIFGLLPDMWVALFTGALTVATILMWIATEKSVSAAKRAATAAERALTSVEAAFVFMSMHGIQPVVANDGRVRGWNISPKLENSGSTRAKWELSHASLYLHDGELPSAFDFPDQWGEDVPIGDRDPRPSFIGPRSFTWAGPVTAHIVDLEYVKEGSKKAYIYGWIEYDDVFQDSKRHRTEYCHEIIVIGDLTDPRATPLHFRTYPRHNGADGECLKQATPYLIAKS
jgi:hypothetical protein